MLGIIALWLGCAQPPPAALVLPEPQEPHRPIRERFPDVSDRDFRVFGTPSPMSAPWQQDQVDAVFVRAGPDFNACYNTEVASAGPFLAEVTLAFQIGPDGLVVPQDDPSEPSFQRCIHARIGRMIFPSWGIDQTWAFSYPLAFSPDNPPATAPGGRQVSASDPETPDAKSVRDTVREKSPQVRYCYESRLRANPSLEGRVEVLWKIEGGRVVSVDIVANTSGDKELASCIADKTRNWQFGPEIAGEVQWPFVFRKGGSPF